MTARTETQLRRLAAVASLLSLTGACGVIGNRAATTTVMLDHNRLLIDAEIQQAGGRWYPARLWVDTGNPDFMVNAASAERLGFAVAAGSPGDAVAGLVELAPPRALRLGGVLIDIAGVKPTMRPGARQWAMMGADANLPSTVLRRYRVIIDYPRSRFTLAAPSGPPPQGTRAAALVHPETGIVQIDGRIDGERVSLALDLGASYSFVSRALVDRWLARRSEWPRFVGASGAANIWGLWPEEGDWPVTRIPVIELGGVELRGVGLVGLPDFFGDGASLGDWYSKRTAQRVEGFLGPNALKAYRVEIDYAGGAVYFEAGAGGTAPDMDVVGLTLQPAPGGRYLVIGVVKKEGIPVVDGIKPGDTLLQIGSLDTTGATMGRVMDALRGTPGDVRTLVVERAGRRYTVEARVRRLL